MFTASVLMGDGCRLATDVYLPGDGQYPVLLAMTPYGRKGLTALAGPVCAAGYAMVIQDVRGRYDSDGSFQPIEQEKSDGPDTVAWLRQQAWFAAAAGIGIIGVSYLGEVGLALAARCPEVRAMVNVGGMADFYAATHRGGALQLHHALPWTIITSRSPQPALRGPDWQQVYATWPLSAAAAAAGFPNPIWDEWSARECRDQYWERWSVRDDLPAVDIPILHFSGWYDICLGPTLELYSYFCQRAQSPQHLVIGPWSHNGVISGGGPLAGVDFGPTAASRSISRMLAWFDRWLRGDPTAAIDQQPVNLFLTGEQRWIGVDQWPPATADQLFLAAGGELCQRMPTNAGTACFRHDPADPVPTYGGAVWEFPLAGLTPGPTDQSPLLTRADVLRWQTPQLTSPLTLAGPVDCRLFAAVAGETADFVVRLIDVQPDGMRRWVADGVVRAHIGPDETTVRPAAPGETYEYRIDLWAAGHTFLAGHRLAVEISGSSAPKWSTNPGCLTGDRQPVLQTVCFGGSRPSALQFHRL